MKNTNRCPKCGHNHLLYVALAKNKEGMDPYTTASYWAKEAHSGTVLGFPADALEAAVCRRCGKIELYVRDPNSLQVDGVAFKEIVGPEPAL